MRTTGCKPIRRADGRPQQGCWRSDGRFVLQRMGGGRRRAPSSKGRRGRRPANKGRVCERFKTVNTVHGRQRRCASYR